MDKYLSNGSNKNFFDAADDDIDDEAFLRHPKSGSSGYMLPQEDRGGGRMGGGGGSNINRHQQDLESQRQELAMKKREIEERTLASSERGLGLLFESEKVGLATAEELTRQKEQLARTEQRLDDINSTLRNSEKHIQGIKSVFGSIRNYFSGRPTAAAGGPGVNPQQPAQPLPPPQHQQQAGRLGDLHRDTAYQDHHPAVRNMAAGVRQNPPGSVDEALDRNLDDMANGLSRLKGLAQGLNEELNEHNDLIDRVNYKTENVGHKVDKQNKDMGKILGKK